MSSTSMTVFLALATLIADGSSCLFSFMSESTTNMTSLWRDNVEEASPSTVPVRGCTGNRTQISVPTFRSLDKIKRPSWSMTKLLTKASPIPEPICCSISSLIRKYRSKTFAMDFSEIPTPVSEITTPNMAESGETRSDSTVIWLLYFGVYAPSTRMVSTETPPSTV